jgi:aspartyl-tRNA(Asn)/glutamyl-tRNA(Gln) amidotransferase subunit A
MTAGDLGRTRQALRSRELSVVEHVAAVLDGIRARDGGIGAFVSVAGDDHAMAAAEAADATIAALGEDAWRRRPLLGVTVAVKDLVQTRDLPTMRGSLLPNRRPAVDAPAVARLRAAGAIVVGKTTTSEYGWCASTVGRLGRPTRNPWAPNRSAGGSSGGSAAAVAAGLCTAALGTDGAGSIRIPAAFCGVVGYKPSYARVPYVPACADRLAHLGPLTRTVADAAELGAIIAGPHAGDPDSTAGRPGAEPYRRALRIGWVEFPGTTAAVREVSERVARALVEDGHTVEHIEVPFADPYPALVDIIAAADASSTSQADEAMADPGRLAVTRHGRTVTGAAVMRAEETRLALRSTLASVLGRRRHDGDNGNGHDRRDRYDLLAMATVPIEPFDVDAIGPDWACDPRELRWLAWSPASYPFNLTGQPAVSLPAGLSRSGLPVGAQLVGPLGADELVLSTARRVEAALGPLISPPAVPARETERVP